MLHLLRNIFTSTYNQRDKRYEHIINLAIELTIDGTDPRLRAVSAYKKKLRYSIETAVEYVIEVIDAMHDPLELSRSGFATNPQVNAYFASAKELEEMIVINPSVREFLVKSMRNNNEYLYLGMGMNKEQKNVFAPELKGEIVHKEVSRTVVNFSEHRFVDPSKSNKTLRRKLKERIFMAIVQCALEKLIEIKDKKQSLEQQRILLNAKLRNLKHHALGIEPFTKIEGHARFSRKELEAKLAEIEKNLKATSASIQTLDQYLEIINHVMANPMDYLKIDNSSTRLTSMNFLASPTDEDPGEEIFYTDFKIHDGKTVVGRIVKFPISDLLTLKNSENRIFSFS